MWKRDRYGTWLPPVDQVWNDGTFIQPAFGIALTQGKHYASAPIPISLAETFAAIPVATSDPPGAIELAWTYDGSSWTRHNASAWETGRAVTIGQPGLAYEPFEPSNYDQGRFYLAWIPLNGDNAVLITQTEGNDSAPLTNGRKFSWRQGPVFLFNKWFRGEGNVSLLFERGIDSNVRGAFTFRGPKKAQPSVLENIPQFFPFADGIFNGPMKDQNDFTVIRANLACSLYTSASCPM